MGKGKQQTTALAVTPVQSLTVTQIDANVEVFLNEALEQTTAPELWVALKQAEETVKRALAKLKEVAAQQAAEAMLGSTKGEILGHKIELRGRTEWQYTPEIDELKDRQKAELRSAQLAEQANGSARKVQLEPTIVVTLRK